MGSLLSYSIVGGLIMLAMYLVYKSFMARENQHGFNRALLLLIYLVSFCAYPFYNYIDNISVESSVASINMIEFENPTFEHVAHPMWGTILIRIYIIGALIVTIQTIITWIRIVCVIRSGTKIGRDGYTLVVIQNDKIAPFSWMRYVVVNSSDLNDRDSAITSHELKHIRSLHCVDLLIAQLVCIINWFNPVAWLMRDELMLVHEYQADMAVIEAGHNPQEYQMLLIKKAVGSRFPSLANSINHSKLKKRITMMYESKSGASSKLKALALVPMVALALSVASMPAVKAAVTTISNSNVSPRKGSENLVDSAKFKITSLNNSGVETTVVVLGDNLGNSLTVSGGTFTNKGKTYSAKSLKTDMEDGRAAIIAVFPFSDNYENASLTLNINGGVVALNVDEFRKNSQVQSVSVSPSNGIAISQGNQPVTTLEDMEIYLDGNIISESEMRELPPGEIGSITLDKQSNRIVIQSKQASEQQPANITNTETIKSEDSKLRADNNLRRSKSIVISGGNSDIPTTSEKEIYLDGKKISEADMNALNPENIASIVIEKQNNHIIITSK